MKQSLFKIGAFAAIVYFNGLIGAGAVLANDVDDLKAQIEELRRDYEAKIQGLQNQINALGAKQDEKVSKIEEKIEKKLINVEYAGRYQGPFEKGGLLIKNPSGFGSVSLGGYADMEFENFQNSNSTFDQARFIMNLGAQANEKMLFYSELEIEHGGTNYSGGNGEVKLEQAWMSYDLTNWATFKGGIVLVPFGKFNILHDSDVQDLTERPLVSRRILGATWTDAGFGLLGDLPVGEKLGWQFLPDFYLNYEGYVVNGLDEDIRDTGIRDARGSASNDLNNSKDFVARVGFGFNPNLELGLTTYKGKFGRSGASTRNGRDDLFGIGADLDFKRGPFELVGDFAYFDFKDGALADDDNDNTTAAVAAPKYMRGFYVEPRYHFWPKFLDNTFLGKGLSNPELTLVSRYDWVNIGDDGDTDTGDNKERRFTLGLNYRPIDSWVFKAEYQWNRTQNEALERGDNNGAMFSMAVGF